MRLSTTRSCFALALIACLASEAQEPNPPADSSKKGCYIPQRTDIEFGIVEVYGHPFWQEDVAQTRLSAESCALIVAEFADSFPEPNIKQTVTELGTLRIVLKGGAAVRYCWYFVGAQDTLLFSCDGVRYKRLHRKFRGEETLALDATVREAIKAQRPEIPDKI